MCDRDNRIFKTVTLDSFEDIKRFNRWCEGFYGDILVSKGHYCVDGKSIMGLLSMELDNVLVQLVSSNENDYVRFAKGEF